MAKKKSQGAPPPPAASTFLTALAQRLAAGAQVDVGLAQILTKHILVGSQADNSVQSAKDAILALASERAQPVAQKDGPNDKS